MDGINYHEEPILRMIWNREQFVETVDLLDKEDVWDDPNFTRIRIFGNSDKVLIHSLENVEVLLSVVIILVHWATDHKHLEELEYEFILNAVLLKLHEILTLLPKQSFS